MREHEAPVPKDVLARLGDGHGRRLLVVDPTVGSALIDLLAEAAARAWAVSVWCADSASSEAGRRAGEAAGLVVDWRGGDPGRQAARGRLFAAVVLCGGSAGTAAYWLARVLEDHAVMMAVLPEGAEVPCLPGLTAVTVTRGSGSTLVCGRISVPGGG